MSFHRIHWEGLYEDTLEEERRGNADVEAEFTDTSHLHLLNQVFTAFIEESQTKEALDDAIKSLTSSRMRFSKELFSYTHASIRYHATVELAEYQSIPTLSIRLNSDGFLYPFLPQKRTVYHPRHGFKGWKQLKPFLLKSLPRVVEFHTKITNDCEPDILYHMEEEKIDIVSFSKGRDSVKVSICFESSHPDFDRFLH